MKGKAEKREEFMTSEGEVYLEKVKEAFRRFRIIFAIAAGIIAGIGGYLVLFRSHPAEAALRKAFRMAEEGDMEGVLSLVDEEGPLGTLLEEDGGRMRRAFEDFLAKYRLEISRPSFRVRSDMNRAEVELKGGTLRVYSRASSGIPAAALSLEDAGLVFYMERKGGRWLVEDVNYDLAQWISGESLPFNW
jgi:hypothetical protein